LIVVPRCFSIMYLPLFLQLQRFLYTKVTDGLRQRHIIQKIAMTFPTGLLTLYFVIWRNSFQKVFVQNNSCQGLMNFFPFTKTSSRNSSISHDLLQRKKTILSILSNLV